MVLGAIGSLWVVRRFVVSPLRRLATSLSTASTQSASTSRAGEAGMGFAVVAEEVRALAQRSAVAARETAE